MMRTVTFIHAADLHLGAPFKGLRALSPVWSDALLRAIPEAFQRVIDTAIEEKVDFVVLAGDIFDNSRPSYADYALFIGGLQRLGEEGIPVYFITGNHDPYTAWRKEFSALPSNAHIMGTDHPTFALYERNGEPLVMLGGRGYFNQAWPAGEDVSAGISRAEAVAALGEKAPFMVGILHTGLDIDPTRSPVDPRELLKRDVDYWACGHIHQQRLLPSADNPRIAFSGCPQGRAMNEVGEHGVLKVTLTQGAPNKVEFIPTAPVTWERTRLDISECSTIAEIHELITNAEFASNSRTRSQRMVFRFTLRGRTPLYRDLTEQVLEDVRAALNDSYPFFFVDAIVNETAPVLDRDQMAAEGLFPSVYLKAVDECRADPKSVLLDLEKQFYQRDLPLPPSLERAFPSLCNEAEVMVLDLLGREGNA